MNKTVSLVVTLVLTMILAYMVPIVAHSACFTPPSGLVSWWGGDNNTLDIVGTNHATLNGATYALGKSNQTCC